MGLTRKQMEETIAAGGSVLHNGKLHTSAATLPSKAKMASSDEDKETAAADLDKQIEALQAQKAKLAKTETKTAKGSEPKGSGDNSEGDGGDDTLDELMKHTRAELVQKAAEAKIEIGEQDTKAQIAEAILAKGK